MPAILRSPVWPHPRVQPPFGSAEIDWSHPLAQGLVLYVVFNQGAGKPRDLVRRRPANTAGSSPATWTWGAWGRTQRWTGAESDWYERDTLMEPPRALWVGAVRRGGTVVADARPFGKTYNNDSAVPWLSYDLEYNPDGIGQNVVSACATMSGGTFQ